MHLPGACVEVLHAKNQSHSLVVLDLQDFLKNKNLEHIVKCGKPKVDAAESNVLSSKTTWFWTKIEMGDKNHFRAILLIDHKTHNSLKYKSIAAY